MIDFLIKVGVYYDGVVVGIVVGVVIVFMIEWKLKIRLELYKFDGNRVRRIWLWFCCGKY